MNALGARFDCWVASGPFTPVDLGVYRIVYAALMLAALPGFRWVDAFPDSLFVPPPGPFRLLGSLPPHGVMLAVEIALAISLAALAVGWRTMVASVAVVVLLLFGYGVSYSLGKIDHSIFRVLVPAALVFARWGDAVSVDALRRRWRGGPQAAAPTPQWAPRLLALLIGLGFVTAAVPKILAGWLDPRSQAVQQTVGRQFYVNGRTELLTPVFVHLDLPVFWEAMDVSAVLLECAVLLTVPWWRSFRVALACATLFHVGVLLMMNIPFSANVVVYAAFVSWSALRWRGLRSGRSSSREPGHRGPGPREPPRWTEIGVVVVVVVVGCGAWVVNQLLDPRPLSWAILAVGGAVSVWYLLRQVVLLVQRPRRPLQIDITDADLPSSQDAVPGGRASLTQSTRPSSTSSATGPSHRL